MCEVKYNEAIGTPFFSFTPPLSVAESLEASKTTISFNHRSKSDLIHDYMNGPRVLSDEHLCHLVLSTAIPTAAAPPGHAEYDLFMCAPHFLGDGTSLHLATHDLLEILASTSTDDQLKYELNLDVNWIMALPPAYEARIDVPKAALARAVSKVDFAKSLDREIGGHTLPRQQHGPQKTVVQETAFSEAETSEILRKCKANNVTVNHVIVALCNIAWARNVSDASLMRNPLMMYTAVTLRPYLSVISATSTYWFVALTYFNIVLPAFLPENEKVFWHRARMVKSQIRQMVQSPFLRSRALEMGKIRVARSRGQTTHLPSFSDIVKGTEVTTQSLPPAPSAALLGLSLIGNLDATYIRSSYPSFHLHTVTTASRQKAGGILLLEHTFANKLWLHLCWDENGFQPGLIQRFWSTLHDVVREFLLQNNWTETFNDWEDGLED
ncbi:hypothetical protein JR316_0012699 [Psilocybe cubensis]|uniref:Uncharacterized protein n=1 Tax=Psilocybe cubensis TaxID=181762 RepID=A0ACB8GJL9_PSICU|nr:hypothetical protein JR316_0012699 [Psilocybe cubensis]KAH9475582.1 hypothetical protein JR316_0012699 [Psilocybe cubensis]